MKRLILTVAVLGLMALTACGGKSGKEIVPVETPTPTCTPTFTPTPTDTPTPTPTYTPSPTPFLSEAKKDLKYGESFVLSVVNGEIASCTTLETDILEVKNDGTVKAVGTGDATVTVVGNNGTSYDCKVNIDPANIKNYSMTMTIWNSDYLSTSDISITGTYEGGMKGGEPSGYGTFTAKDGSFVYTGDFKMGQIEGYGTMTFPSVPNLEETGRFNGGLFRPDPLEAIYTVYKLSFGAEISPDTMNAAFMHNEYFIETLAYLSSRAEIVDVRELRKKLQGYYSKHLYMEDYVIAEIKEMNFCGITFTLFSAVDGDNNVALIFTPDTLDGVYNGDTVDFYGFPAGELYMQTSDGVVPMVSYISTRVLRREYTEEE